MIDAASRESPVFVHDLDVAKLRELQGRVAQLAEKAVFFADSLSDGQTGPEMAVIPPGEFVMGSSTSERRFGDLPERREYLDHPFALGRNCVTADEFERFAESTGFYWREDLIRAEGAQPVINVRFNEAEAYCAWLSKETGARYRLPDEIEWEYAARAGSRTAYCFGDRLTCGEANIHTIQPPASQVKGWRRFLPFCVPLSKAVDVGRFPANVWGLYEVHGNVWEFTRDIWLGVLDSRNTPQKPGARWIVTKGGSWFEGALDARCAARKPRFHDELDINLGFRVLREL